MEINFSGPLVWAKRKPWLASLMWRWEVKTTDVLSSPRRNVCVPEVRLTEDRSLEGARVRNKRRVGALAQWPRCLFCPFNGTCSWLNRKMFCLVKSLFKQSYIILIFLANCVQDCLISAVLRSTSRFAFYFRCRHSILTVPLKWNHTRESPLNFCSCVYNTNDPFGYFPLKV